MQTVQRSDRSVRPFLIGCYVLSGACSIADGPTPGATTQRASLITADAAADDAGVDEDRLLRNARGEPGLLAGTMVWQFPDTPNGLKPNQSWFSVAGSPSGTIYASACDHTTNTGLYRLRPGSNLLQYVGDARAASEAADNWLQGETAEKFHVRPLWYDERLYVATADYSNQDDVYLERRGYHWYAYEEQRRRFVDLSARDESNGVAAEHISIFASELDAGRGLIYALGSPTGHLYQYEIASGKTTDLGRAPELTRPYYNPGRFIWIDKEGRVYITVANGGTPGPNEPQAPKYVLACDPSLGWQSKTDWAIAEMLRTGQRSLDGQRVYILDYKLNLYVFDEAAGSFTKLAQGQLPDEFVSMRTNGIRVRSMNLSANEKKIYFVNDSAGANALWEWELAAGTTPRELARTTALSERLEPAYDGFTGHDSWDDRGRFAFTAFGGEVDPTPFVYLVRVDPVRLKADLGQLPGVPEVFLRDARPARRLARTGDLTTELDVIIESQSANGAGLRSYHHVKLPAGQASTPLPNELTGERLRIIPDGDTYVTRSRRR